MRTVSKLVIIASILTTSLSAYAITISVKSSAKDIQGLGFTTQGKQYGGMGSSYKKSGMKPGEYEFGLRKDGKDIGCSADGKKQAQLSKSTHVLLMLKDGQCEAKIK
jgi:hypothetical protein